MSETLAFGGIDTALGRLLAGVTETGVAWFTFHDTPAVRERAAKTIALPVVDDPHRLEPVLARVADYFAGGLKEFDLPIDWRLTSRLQQQVLTTLYETVGYGAVLTYGELGDRSGAAVPAQAIGQVMGSNPIPLIVPCHRVVASNGLGGYSGGSGIEVKRWLLTLEGHLPPTLDWDPTHFTPTQHA
ncbi:methylated-DNA--[protein]-cysteine S-methyltransferase [Spirillospora sp. CA-294931]|uniref:methylated-DNA--[protein]-cysteine S-methyltransferase n=1 Tax=Spirillospora sp. CA-294931 TaxID=3240042 RepID=UPI003D94302C